MFEWLFIAACLAVLYPYLIYPLLLAAVPSRPEPASSGEGRLPRVAILLSAYNEEQRIADKIGNFLALDYPPEQLSLWIGSDGSTDATAKAVRSIAHPRVRLVERLSRSGKTTILNELAMQADADVFVFTDTNALFRPTALRELVRPFRDPGVGLVSGHTKIKGEGGNTDSEGAYYRFEYWLKSRESNAGWLTGADGAIYALRAGLYTPLDPSLINDFVHPCQAATAGYICRFAPAAISEETAGDDAGREFARQTRMTAQAVHVVASQFAPLASRGRWGMLWVLFSHKFLRWILLAWAAVACLCLFALAAHSLWAAAGAVLALVLMIFLGVLAKRPPSRGLLQLLLFFFLVHLAYLRGFWHYCKGERYVTWKPRAG
jgi:cellulose synthase/poly-beta-1,6-N-acetylglucosamine synthase-like glycosyltransferase